MSHDSNIPVGDKPPFSPGSMSAAFAAWRRRFVVPLPEQAKIAASIAEGAALRPRYGFMIVMAAYWDRIGNRNLTLVMLYAFMMLSLVPLTGWSGQISSDWVCRTWTE